ncbi:MAG: hypoxanthine phosphoribosyltransferase [Clostridia bacterium]|nr:hypoxanthine phosphoribosyltransferase [Clostridia bacterium]
MIDKADISKVLLTEEEIKEIVKKLGKQISEDYKDKNLLLVSVLKGSVMFMADLMREINVHCKIDFMAVSSYGAGTSTSGSVKILKDLNIDLTGYDLLIVEDILDSGVTLSNLRDMLLTRHPASFKICTFIDKPERRKADVKADYVGAEIPDAFVVGYGLDYDERYRNLPYLGILDPKVYTK